MKTVFIVCISAALSFTACGKSAPAYKEKTQQERAESYHRDLTTPDLQLFRLRGNVLSAEAMLTKGAANGQSLYLRFMPNGMLESIIYGGDSLTIVRNNSGEVLQMLSPSGQDVKPEIINGYDSLSHVIYY